MYWLISAVVALKSDLGSVTSLQEYPMVIKENQPRMWDDRKYELVVDIPHSPFGLVWDVHGPPVSIYGHPTSEARFPFIICQIVQK